MGDEDARTLFVGSIPPEATEDLLYELFLQAGPLVKVNIPKDKDGTRKKFGFVLFKHESSVPYSIELFRGTKLFGRELLLKRRNTDGTPSPAATPLPPSGGMFQNDGQQFMGTMSCNVQLSGSFSGGRGLLNNPRNGLFDGNFPQFVDSRQQQFRNSPGSYGSPQHGRFQDMPQGGFDHRRSGDQGRFQGRDRDFEERRFGDGRYDSGRDRDGYNGEQYHGSGDRFRNRRDDYGERGYDERRSRDFDSRDRNGGGYSRQGSQGSRRW